ncbi:MAG TPA: rRNA pseudouridine synthase [Peptococcaceae bacterium]|nr:rRNA pseudouridine synthase [Peptococcaceae bacterium]
MNEAGQKQERLQKAIARLGIASRRHAEELIQKGLVKVNGEIVRELGRKVSESDLIEVGRNSFLPVQKKNFVYILLHKPEGVISSVTDPQKRKTVIDLVRPKIKERVYPVGRLDYDTSGIIILTNDGELTYRLTHPSFGVEKKYRVWLNTKISREALQTLEEGVFLEDGMTSPAKINCVTSIKKKGKTFFVVEISIHEGKNRQVRRMFEKVGFPLVSLQRIAFGPIKLDNNLQPGEFRLLSNSEISALKREVGLSE